ncbi:MAG: hypothetical protein VKK04_20435 [Synechococcales bacterium]|nr:hypothetical protein [Synechococcales bacterium]
MRVRHKIDAELKRRHEEYISQGIHRVKAALEGYSAKDAQEILLRSLDCISPKTLIDLLDYNQGYSSGAALDPTVGQNFGRSPES